MDKNTRLADITVGDLIALVNKLIGAPAQNIPAQNTTQGAPVYTPPSADIPAPPPPGSCHATPACRPAPRAAPAMPEKPTLPQEDAAAFEGIMFEKENRALGHALIRKLDPETVVRIAGFALKGHDPDLPVDALRDMLDEWVDTDWNM